MEEKERYELFGEFCIKDNNINAKCQLLDTYKSCVILNQQDKRIKELEAKLAEKERQLKLAEELLIKQEKEYDEQLEKQAKIHYRHLKEKDQDKISFAIAELEKVKEIIANHTQELWTCENDDIDVVLYEEIDKQIKQLKEGK